MKKIAQRATLAAAVISFASCLVAALMKLQKASTLSDKWWVAEYQQEAVAMVGLAVALPLAIFGAYILINWIITGSMKLTAPSQVQSPSKPHAQSQSGH